jgi:hypothetical protein
MVCGKKKAELYGKAASSAAELVKRSAMEDSTLDLKKLLAKSTIECPGCGRSFIIGPDYRAIIETAIEAWPTLVNPVQTPKKSKNRGGTDPVVGELAQIVAVALDLSLKMAQKLLLLALNNDDFIEYLIDFIEENYLMDSSDN